MVQIFFAVFASAFVLIGYVLYIRDILKHGVKPHQYTFGIWTLLAVVLTINQFRNGGGASTLFFVTTLIFLAVIFLLSLKYGERGSSNLDRICLVLSLALFVYWLITLDSEYSTYIATGIDVIAVLPTIYKTYLRPKTETYLPWMLSSVAAFLTILSLPNYRLVILIYPLYVLIADSAIPLIKFFRESGNKK